MRHFVIEPRIVSYEDKEYTITSYTILLNGEKLANAILLNVDGGEIQISDIEIRKNLMKLLVKNNSRSKKNKKLEIIKAKSIVV